MVRRASVLVILGLFCSWSNGQHQYLNHRPFPTYSLEQMPDTEFSCRDKILGGYYADPQAECQMFHVCVKVAGIGVQDFRFLCPNGTAFDQDHQICAEWEDVDCDATTLYYSSDNFDLYRIGSGFESKAVKYGEEEEPFALQRAETGDHRLSREHQVQKVNQQREISNPFIRKQARQNNNNNYNKPNNDNNERDIFKVSSSSNFFNNRNNGKENDEDYDDNININQNRDFEQRRKNRKQIKRPTTPPPPPQNNQNNEYNRNNNQNNRNFNEQNNYDNRNRQQQYQPQQQQQQQQPQENYEVQTRRPQRPTGFKNNFAGSSFVPTTAKPSTAAENVEQTNPTNNFRSRNGLRQQYNNNNNFAQTNQNNPPTPTYTISTPAPFKQTQQYNNAPNRQTTQNNQYYTTSAPRKSTENYPQPRPTTLPPNYNSNFNKQTEATENYPSNNPQYNNNFDKKPTTPFKQSENYPSGFEKKPTTPFKQPENYPSNFDKKPTTPFKQTENYPTTLPPKPKPFSTQNTQQNSQSVNSFPTTFAPRTNAAYTQISQQTTNFNKKQQSTQYNPPSTFQQQNSQTTQRPSTFTQYTPTVPKITQTTPVSRSNNQRSTRFDETQYDDGSYDPKYDRQEDEFLKAAHSQNIASSRNEYARTTKQQQPTQRAYTESQKPYSNSPNTPKVAPKVTEYTKPAQRPTQSSSPAPVQKKVKDVSYDYAYYDSGVGSEPDYEIDTEIKKSTAKN